MNTPAKKTAAVIPGGVDFFAHMWEDSWTYIKTVVDAVREPVLILDKNLYVLAGNESFYRTFQVDIHETENTLVYKLGDGQWDIPDLRRLLEDILPKNTFFNGFKVTHDFPSIGRKIMILNARQIHYRNDKTSEVCPPIILLAMEDVTEMMGVAESVANHIGEMEKSLLIKTTQCRQVLKKCRKRSKSSKTNTSE
jgi:hypothetical protein